MRTAVFAVATVCSLLLTVALGLALWVAVPTAVLDWRPTLVTSGSMEPLVSAGDVVLVRPVDAGAVGVGTVVLYDMPGTGPVLHRVVALLDDGSLVTQGDANEVADSAPVRADQVLGAGVLQVPWVGLPSLWLGRGDVVRVVLAAVLLVAAVGVAPRAGDPTYDPWLGRGPVLPADLLLAPRGVPSPSTGGELLPPHQMRLLLAQLAGAAHATPAQGVRP